MGDQSKIAATLTPTPAAAMKILAKKRGNEWPAHMSGGG
jgi:hypothetical protein